MAAYGYSGSDAFLTKLSEDGAVLWQKGYNPAYAGPHPVALAQTPEGGVAIGCRIEGPAPSIQTLDWDIGLLKTDGAGALNDPCTEVDEFSRFRSETLAAPADPPGQLWQKTVSVVDTPGQVITPSLVEAQTACPVVTSVNILQSPFRLDVKGLNFYWAHVQAVKINGDAVPKTTWKNGHEIIAKKDTALKAMVPKGVPVCITVEDDDQHPLFKSACFTFAR